MARFTDGWRISFVRDSEQPSQEMVNSWQARALAAVKISRQIGDNTLPAWVYELAGEKVPENAPGQKVRSPKPDLVGV
ncbi:hypothetical protein ACUH92_08900 [Dermabacteraceae bacterium CCM 9520]